MAATVTAAATAVDATSFVTASSASAEAFKTANLLKLLTVNALISGEKGTGRLTLARYILSNAPVIDACNFDELLVAMQSSSEIIITHIEKTSNLDLLQENIRKYGVRVVATGSDNFGDGRLEEIFAVRLFLPPLSERREDIAMLQQHYLAEAQRIFGKTKPLDLESIEPDLSENGSSLRRQLFLHYLLKNISRAELMKITEEYLYDKMGSSNDYREFLHLYEVPLIRAGLNKYKSQLQLAERLGLNRNTLRKKIAENKEYQLDE